MRFYPPKNRAWVSHTLMLTDRVATRNHYIEVPVKRLETIMHSLNHTAIHLLKVDVEGIENPLLQPARNQPRSRSIIFSVVSQPKGCFSTRVEEIGEVAAKRFRAGSSTYWKLPSVLYS